MPASRRLRLVVLLHMPIGCRDDDDGSPSARVPSWAPPPRWSPRATGPAGGCSTPTTSTRLGSASPSPASTPPHPPRAATAGGNLLCVGAVTPGKGHDVLLAALTPIADLDWRCTCVGALTKAPDFVDDLCGDIRTAGLADRLVLTGPRTGDELEASYAEADVLVLASRAETYGMVVTEALARALPVLAPDVGGVPEALGVAPDGRRPGLLLPPGDVAALADSLRRWLCEPTCAGSPRGGRPVGPGCPVGRRPPTGWPGSCGGGRMSGRSWRSCALPPVRRSSARCCGGPGPVRSSTASARSTAGPSPSARPSPFRRPSRARGAGTSSRGSSASGWTWVPRWPPATAPSSSTPPCPAGSWVTCTAACATGGTPVTPARAARRRLGTACRPGRAGGHRGRGPAAPPVAGAFVRAGGARRAAWCSWPVPWWSGTFRIPEATSLVTRVLRAVRDDLRAAPCPAGLAGRGVRLDGGRGLLPLDVRRRGAGRRRHDLALTLLPLALLVFLAAGLPLNLAGWGPREGMAAWCFGAAGLGADQGVATAVAYGAMVIVASLPGAVVLLVASVVVAERAGRDASRCSPHRRGRRAHG